MELLYGGYQRIWTEITPQFSTSFRHIMSMVTRTGWETSRRRPHYSDWRMSPLNISKSINSAAYSKRGPRATIIKKAFILWRYHSYRWMRTCRIYNLLIWKQHFKTWKSQRSMNRLFVTRISILRLATINQLIIKELKKCKSIWISCKSCVPMGTYNSMWILKIN